MKIIILLGPPGSGKGTTAERIQERTGYTHVSTGDMLREAVKKDSEVGRKARSYMEKGELVPDDVMVRIIEERFEAGDSDAQYMLDGFPRTPEQAEMLDRAVAGRGGEIKNVVFLDAPRDVLISRLSGRRVCRNCGATYHVVNMPPQKEGICDACGGELYQRPDDSEDTIANRLDVYNRQTESLVEMYQKKGLLVRVKADQPADRLADEVAGIMESE